MGKENALSLEENAMNTPMENKVALSIIIINYNTAALTKACLDSIYNQIGGTSFEVIVIDNASSDTSVDVLSSQQYENYKYVYNHTNIGFSKANNQGAEMASGETYFFLNSDMEFLNDVASILMQRMKHEEDIGVIGPKFVNPDGTLQVSCRNFPDLYSGISRFFPFLKSLLENQVASYYQHERDYTIEQPVDTVSAGALMISKTLFDEIGGFDPFSFMYAEDADICRQVRDRGYRVLYCPEAQVLHYGGQSSCLNSNKAVWSYYFAFYHLYRKYYFGKMALLIKPLFFMRAIFAMVMNQFKTDKRITWNSKK